jgi:broad specificity phosphatase PhoE
MRTLLLIKHAKPEQREGVPSHDWPLSQAGREAAKLLAEKIRHHRPAVVVSSDEPKAMETAQIIAQSLQTPVETQPGLEEHDRSNVPMMATAEFVSTMALFFKQPNKLVLGEETAKGALWRFEEAMEEVLKKHPGGNIAVVSHGTVLALYLAKHLQLDGYQLWRQMGLPAYVAVEEPEMNVVERVDRI